MYDIAIIGSGPAGYSAGIYTSRYQLKTVIFGKMIGGTISEAHKVCNYAGIEEISGLDLSMQMYEHSVKSGCENIFESITDVQKQADHFILTSDSGKTYQSKTILLATGTERTKLTIPDEDKYLGKGLSYCATCDANFYKGKVVGVIGGSNAATMAANMLSDVASKVYVIYRGTELKGEPTWVKQTLERENVEVIFTTLVTGLIGDEKLTSVKLSKEYNGSNILELDGIFVEIGSEPNKDLPLKIGVEVNEKGYIVVDEAQKTSIEGIWAAGDCTTNSNGFRQVATAVGEGAVASNDIYRYLQK